MTVYAVRQEGNYRRDQIIALHETLEGAKAHAEEDSECEGAERPFVWCKSERASTWRLYDVSGTWPICWVLMLEIQRP